MAGKLDFRESWAASANVFTDRPKQPIAPADVALNWRTNQTAHVEARARGYLHARMNMSVMPFPAPWKRGPTPPGWDKGGTWQVGNVLDVEHAPLDADEHAALLLHEALHFVHRQGGNLFGLGGPHARERRRRAGAARVRGAKGGSMRSGWEAAAFGKRIGSKGWV